MTNRSILASISPPIRVAGRSWSQVHVSRRGVVDGCRTSWLNRFVTVRRTATRRIPSALLCCWPSRTPGASGSLLADFRALVPTHPCSRERAWHKAMLVDYLLDHPLHPGEFSLGHLGFSSSALELRTVINVYLCVVSMIERKFRQ